ncbi:sporulation initiation inhibitor Soj [Spirochaetia bacterium]|nr:sporulation initiation inhibitor Soj [Spirochaetia bacterium]
MILTVTSWKGGTGKTTLAVLAAIILAARGKRSLIVDLDSNCAISQVFGQVLKDFTSMEFLSGNGENFKGVYSARQNIDIIPGSLNNMLLNNIMDRQLKINLKRAGYTEAYDYIIIDPPGYWGAHTRNAVFSADTIVIPGACSRIDYEATRLYFRTLRECYIEANTLVCVNAFNAESNLPGIHDEYKSEFGEFLLAEPVPYIKSLKKLTSDPDYTLQAGIRKRLERTVDAITGTKGGENA